MSPRPELRDVAVVICTYRSRGEIDEALRSCLGAGLSQGQLTVVDNASPDGTADLVAARHPLVRLMRNQANLGFARANNLGAAGAGGEFLLLLNPDAELTGDALSTMLEALGEAPLRAAVSPRIERPDGSLDAACRRSFPTPLSALWRLSGLSRLRPESARFGAYNLTHLPADRAGEIDSGSGACLLIRRSVFERLRGFDERFFMYGEDLDLCWRVRELGLSVWYVPSAVVRHRKGRSSRQEALPMLVQFHRSMWLFYRLHYLRGPRALLAPLVALGILGRLSLLLLLNAARREPLVSP